jgi:hypothetical protein
MLKRILTSIKNGSILMYEDLARENNTDVNTVKLMVEDMVEMGYLVRLNADGSRGGCSGCVKICSVKNNGKGSLGKVGLLELSPKALDYLKT